ncbi:MAG TPA: hypothetical protein VMF14_17370 [Solirubrobacteraceae bacterium]|nr:hypothetical protein [Solirubrobacteraceae bacterium]
MTDLPELAEPAPDLIDPIIGYRQWRLVRGALTSLFNDTRWERVQLSARCHGGDHHPEVVPEHACSCGIYAYYDPCPRTASAVTRELVAGAVVMWGRVELHGTGLRAEHARIVGLELPLSLGPKRRHVLQVADQLGVAAVPHRQLRSVAREHGAPVDQSLRPPRVRQPVVSSWRWSLVS